MQGNELILYTNKKLKEGLNLSEIEKELKVGKDTIRKKLKDLGYKYDRSTKQYIEIKDNKTKSYKNSVKSDFTSEEILFIKKLYKQHKLINEINRTETKSEIINRSVRVDAAAMEQFANLCKEKNIKQTQALTQALIDFMKKVNNL